jgi:hypothetical protein
MENSHHAAKAAYHRHTQHAGGKGKKSPILQTYQHWYRIIQHRFHHKELEQQQCQAVTSDQILDDTIIEERIQARRNASLNSIAAQRSAEWRAKRIRVGKRWLPLEEETVSTNIDDEEA